MTDTPRKISELSALTTPASDDYLPIVDVSEATLAAKNKRITIEELFRGAPDGTAAAPSIAFESDYNTGIYSPGADQFAISTGGTGRLFVDAIGNVLIGAAAAVANSRFLVAGVTGNTPLTVQGASGNSAALAFYNNAASTDRFVIGQGYSSGSDNIAFIQNNANAALVLGTNFAERARIASTGELLVGTTTTTANGGKLQVSNGITFPATQVACSDANTLDDYEEGTWTPTQGAGVTVVGTFSSVGSYVKIGKQVSFAGYITATTSVAFNPAGGAIVGGLPFSVLSGIGSGTGCNAAISTVISVIPSGTGISGGASIAATSVIYFAGTYPT